LDISTKRKLYSYYNTLYKLRLQTSVIFTVDSSSCSSDNEIDSEDSDIEISNMKSMFSNIKNTKKDNDKMCLPRHMRCSVHRLTLIPTCDVSKITDANYVKIPIIHLINFLIF